MSPEKPRRLGRGLEALIPGSVTATPAAAVPASDLQTVPLSRIRPNPFQPRREFDKAELAELEASLKASGLLQPITVRRRGDAYELIAGERRYRAATNLGWTEISAIVREFDDRTMLVLALVENLQRASLNAIEEARGYRRLIDEFQLTQQQVAEVVGKDRTTVTNLLRVLTLPTPVQQLVEAAKLSTGHARALLALTSQHNPLEVANTAVARGMSVRELEQHVRELIDPTTSAGSAVPEGAPKKGVSKPKQDAAARRIEDDLRKHFQTDVRLNLTGDSKGKIELSFYTNEDLGRILDMILGDKRSDF